ncbi:TRAP transporter small permease [Alcaligenaceae bacterium CGII-47]|nr:TRAP transporter small permease [Alcaligenaceae bacterium CGII-47]
MAIRNNRIIHTCAPLVRVTAIISGYSLLALSFLIGFDVVARKLFNFSSVGADEIGGYIVATMAAFGFTYALIEHAHTRIDIFYKSFPIPLRIVANLLSMLGMVGFASFIAWRAWDTLNESITYQSAANTPLHTPQWIPQSIWFVGLLIFAVVSIVLLAHALLLSFRDAPRALQYYGPQTLEEEIEQELSDVEGLDDPGAHPPTSQKETLP